MTRLPNGQWRKAFEYACIKSSWRGVTPTALSRVWCAQFLIRFEADEANIRALLPPGLEPASAVVTLNMYVVPHGLGIPPYTRSYIWADLKGFDAWDGTQGRCVLVGRTDRVQGDRDHAAALAG